MTGEDDGRGSADQLIERLRARAADPKRRTEYQAGPLASLFRSLGRRLSVDPPMDVPTAEAALGLTFEPFLARVYAEVGNGGFGPGEGLVPLERLVRETRELRTGGLMPRNRTWPPTLVAVVELQPGWTCVDVSSGVVIDWDPEDLEERTSEARFQRSFAERAPSVEAWLGAWVNRKTAADRNKLSPDERWARMRARAQSPAGQAWQARKTKAALEQVSPEDRARWGLDDLDL